MRKYDAAKFACGPASCRTGFFLDFARRDSLFAPNVLRRFVFTQALKRRMPKQPVVGPIPEGDFRDQFRSEPVHAPLGPTASAFTTKGDFLDHQTG